MAPLLLAIPAQMLFAQGATRTLSKPDVEYSEPLTRIVGVRELRDGRVIVADQDEKSVQLVDLVKQSAQKIAREGQGPGEYSLPGGLFAAPGDTTLLYDVLNRRFLAIAPGGKPGEFLSAAPTASGTGMGGGMMVFSLGGVSMDASGRVYSTGQQVQPGPQGPVYSDSVPVTRYDRPRNRMDTLAYVAVPKNAIQVTSSTAGNLQMRGRVTPFEPRDVWAVAPDGRIAVVRVSDYHVEWVSPTGARSKGPAVPYQPLKVTEADKEAFRKGQGRGRVVTSTMNGSGPPQIQMGGQLPANIQIPEPEWPEFRPPFSTGAALVTPTGELWVLRSRTASDSVPVYDVFDGVGRVTGKVVLPKRTAVVGFGSGTVYLARTDEDDLQYLQRYRM
jgi:hypothetical protein